MLLSTVASGGGYRLSNLLPGKRAVGAVAPATRRAWDIPSPKQIQAFYRKLGPKLRFLYLSREYLNRIGVPPDDEPYRAVEKAS